MEHSLDVLGYGVSEPWWWILDAGEFLMDSRQVFDDHEQEDRRRLVIGAFLLQPPSGYESFAMRDY